jgi:hypothetical protein
LAWTLPLALPLTARLIMEVAHKIPRRWRLAGTTVALAFGIASAITFCFLSVRLAFQPAIQTPAGKVAFRERSVSELVGKVMALPRNEQVFFYPYMPAVPFVTRRDQVGSYDIFLPYYTTKGQYQDAAAAVSRDAGWVVYDKRDSDPRHMKEIYPRMPASLPAEYFAMERLLRTRFDPVWSNDRFEIRRRRR